LLPGAAAAPAAKAFATPDGAKDAPEVETAPSAAAPKMLPPACGLLPNMAASPPKTLRPLPPDAAADADCSAEPSFGGGLPKNPGASSKLRLPLTSRRRDRTSSEPPRRAIRGPSRQQPSPVRICAGASGARPSAAGLADRDGASATTTRHSAAADAPDLLRITHHKAPAFAVLIVESCIVAPCRMEWIHVKRDCARTHKSQRSPFSSCPATVHGVCAPAPRGRSRTRTWSFALSRSPLLQMARSSSKTCLSGTKPACARAFRCLRRWAVRIHNFDSVCSMRRRHVFTGRVVMHQLRRWNVFAVRIHNFDSLCSRTAGTYSLAWSSCTNCGLSLLKKRSGSLPQPARVIYEVLLAFEDSGGQACAHGVSVCAASTPPTESGCRTRLSTWTA